MEAVLFNETRLQQTHFAQKIQMLSLMHFLCSFIQSYESKTHSSPLNLEEQTTYWHKQELVV